MSDTKEIIEYVRGCINGVQKVTFGKETVQSLLDAIEQAEPRALRWTHEPPKVAGKYWWRPSGKKIGRIRDMFVRNGEVGFLDRNDRFIKDTGDGEWAGPIPAPID